MQLTCILADKKGEGLNLYHVFVQPTPILMGLKPQPCISAAWLYTVGGCVLSHDHMSHDHISHEMMIGGAHVESNGCQK